MLARGGLEHLADAHNRPAFVWPEPQSKRRCVGNDVVHPAIRDVDIQRAELRYLQRGIKLDGESRHIAKGDVTHFAVGTLGAHMDQARGRLQDDVGDGLTHGQHARLEQHRGDADGVAP